MKVKCTSSFYIVNKGVFNNGSIVEFEEELARKLIKQGVVVEYTENEETIKKEENIQNDEKEVIIQTEVIEVEKEIDYNTLTVKALKSLLEEKGLSTKGKKAELIERLKGN